MVKLASIWRELPRTTKLLRTGQGMKSKASFLRSKGVQIARSTISRREKWEKP
jgi:hypothetical protein